jgi:hypothetical protein
MAWRLEDDIDKLQLIAGSIPLPSVLLIQAECGEPTSGLEQLT